jgi:uncharacterized protein YcfL
LIGELAPLIFLERIYKMKKYLLLLISVVCLVFVSCSNKESKTSKESEVIGTDEAKTGDATATTPALPTKDATVVPVADPMNDPQTAEMSNIAL